MPVINSSRPNGNLSRSYSGRRRSSIAAEVQISSGKATARDSRQTFSNFIAGSFRFRTGSVGLRWRGGSWTHRKLDDLLIEIIRAQAGIDRDRRPVDSAAALAEQKDCGVRDFLRGEVAL